MANNINYFDITSTLYIWNLKYHDISCNIVELPWPSGYVLLLSLMGSNPGKSHWWITGRASSPKMLIAPAKS